MIARKRSIDQIVDEQVKKWSFGHREKSDHSAAITMITVSREPGSGGKLIAKGIAEYLGYDLFHQEMIHEMALSTKVSARVLESLDEKGLSMLDDWVSAVVLQQHLWPDEYLQHLLKVVSAIGRHGNAVLVGRGANFILPAEKTLRLRVIAPSAFRAKKVAVAYDLSQKEAEQRILNTDSNRRAFVRKYFHKEISDPIYYDIVINTAMLQLEEAVEAACRIIQLKNK
jgi:cytidylate kinase